MPATSKKQKTMFCIALSMKMGKTPKNYSAQAAKMSETMTDKQLEDYCQSPIKK